MFFSDEYSAYSLDDPGFATPSAPPSAPPSSVDDPSAVRRYCWMSRMTVDHHILYISCRGSACVTDNRCEECMEWPEGVITLYA